MTIQERFIEIIAPLIKKEALARGYKFPSAIIAQACLESAYGESGLSKSYHNYFGMKCGSKWTGKSVNMKTKEEYNSQLVSIRDNFRVYDSMEEGVIGYFNFINTSRYANLKNAKSEREYLELIKQDGYATSSSYVKNVMSVIDKYGLTRFDEHTEPKPITPELISKIISGVYGNGAARERALTAEGYDYPKVRAKVNEVYELSKKVALIKKESGDYWNCVLEFLK